MDTTNIKQIGSVIATKSSKIRSLPIENGQMIFIRDIGRIALDYDDSRVFYNQIVEIKTDIERLTLDSPLPGYYFVIDTAILWFYKEQWIQVTEKPAEILQVGVDLPELGQAREKVLYVNKAKKEIAIFDNASMDYIIVSNYTNEATDEDIENMFR